jgi:hypothetical protein
LLFVLDAARGHQPAKAEMCRALHRWQARGMPSAHFDAVMTLAFGEGAAAVREQLSLIDSQAASGAAAVDPLRWQSARWQAVQPAAKELLADGTVQLACRDLWKQLSGSRGGDSRTEQFIADPSLMGKLCRGAEAAATEFLF